MAHLLVTGGAGFIGTHTCLNLLKAGHMLTVVDNFSNSSPKFLGTIMKLSGSTKIDVIQGDICDYQEIDNIFLKHSKSEQPIKAVIHLAGRKAVGESVKEPLRYWNVNVCGTKNLLDAMDKHNCNKIVFSSSATIYGRPESIPIKEISQIAPINPYGNTKATVEIMLNDIFKSAPKVWSVINLRYFNPVGAHPSGLIGENPSGVPNNLFPLIGQVAVGERDILHIFGGDWETNDGTGIRDYIHVMDVADGHLAAINYLLNNEPQYLELNLGTGRGHSVLEVISAYEAASNRSIPYKIVERRPGDVPISVADPSLAYKYLGWRSKRTLTDMCKDGWAWQSAKIHG